MLNDYTMEVHRVLSSLPLDAISQAAHWLRGTRQMKGTVYLAGNGGSSSTAEHFACDLQRVGVRAVCLTNNIASLTAFSNDVDYEQSLTLILSNLAKPGDGLIAISTSGNSENVVRVAKYGRFNGLYVVGMTGESGGELAKVVDANLAVKSDETDVAEDLHLVMVHLIIRELKSD